MTRTRALMAPILVLVLMLALAAPAFGDDGTTPPADTGAPPDTTPEATPETVPETIPETTPETVPETVPEMTDPVAEVTEEASAPVADQIGSEPSPVTATASDTDAADSAGGGLA